MKDFIMWISTYIIAKSTRGLGRGGIIDGFKRYLPTVNVLHISVPRLFYYHLRTTFEA
ncbi:MAG: hypothetical protein JZD40_05800 [Sulfolobus sp.]|nr:hypothetical protein [Sulfolobus sp.]